MGIPLELNFGGILVGRKLSDGEYAYPHSLFWEIAAEEKVTTLYGVDAHSAKQFDLMGNCKDKADIIINPNKLTLVNKDYNPVEARKNNPLLTAAYRESQSKALSYETNLVSYITNDVMSRIPEEGFEPDIFSGMTSYMFGAVLKDSRAKADAKKKLLIEKGQEAFKIGDSISQERITTSFTGVERTYSNQEQALERAKATIRTATELGCTTKAEYRKVIRNLTEQKSKSAQKTNSEVKETTKKEPQKGPVLVKKKPSTPNNGYISTLTLLFIITSLFAIGCILLNLK